MGTLLRCASLVLALSLLVTGLALADAARSLEAAGASFLVLCTNTMHKVAHYIEAAVAIELLHIADPTASEIKKSGHSVVGLLGTRFTMEQSFYRERLLQRHGLQVNVPAIHDREIIHRIIYEELCLLLLNAAHTHPFYLPGYSFSILHNFHCHLKETNFHHLISSSYKILSAISHFLFLFCLLKSD